MKMPEVNPNNAIEKVSELTAHFHQTATRLDEILYILETNSDEGILHRGWNTQQLMNFASLWSRFVLDFNEVGEQLHNLYF